MGHFGASLPSQSLGQFCRKGSKKVSGEVEVHKTPETPEHLRVQPANGVVFQREHLKGGEVAKSADRNSLDEVIGKVDLAQKGGIEPQKAVDVRSLDAERLEVQTAQAESFEGPRLNRADNGGLKDGQGVEDRAGSGELRQLIDVVKPLADDASRQVGHDARAPGVHRRTSRVLRTDR